MRGTFVIAALILVGCSHTSIVCPDGETVRVLNNIEDAYPVYAKDYEAQFKLATSQLAKVASDVNVSAEFKSNIVKLRQDLDQERSALQDRFKTMVISLQTTPCDKDVRKRFWDLLDEQKHRASQIQDRVKRTGVNVQEMKNSPGGVQIGSADSITIHQYSGRTDDLASVRLKSDIEKLLRFPDAVEDRLKPPSVIERMQRNNNTMPRRLFDLIMPYSEQVIMEVPKIGNALHSHKTSYYQFREKALNLEARLITRIAQMTRSGQTVQLNDSVAWRMYLQYAIMRFQGHSKESIIATGFRLNFDITWDDTERVFVQLSNEPPFPREISELVALHMSLMEDVRKIKSEI